MNWNWQVIIDSLPTLMTASLTTIGLVVISGILGLMLAVPLGLARVSKNGGCKPCRLVLFSFFVARRYWYRFS